jgi:ATP-dependent Clp protease ATP-binding subunit ClpB
MNINKFTIKSQGLQQSPTMAQGYGQQQIENRTFFKAIFGDENVAPFILKKLNVNVPLFIQVLDSTIQSFQSFWWRSHVSREQSA